jgi:peptide/nickel transport system substrate-binding protein
MPRQSDTSTNNGRISKISRRTLLGVGAGAAVAHTLWLPSSAQAQTPVRGGNFRIGLTGGNSSDSMDPMLGIVGVVRNVCYATYDTLTELSPTGEVLPSLAESFEPSADSTQWIFNIRKGVQFHDGRSLTADDVIYTIGRHIAPNSRSPLRGILAGITEIKKESSHQIRISLSSGNAELPVYFNDYRASIIPNGTTDFSKPVGAGGYKLVRFQPGVAAAGERNPNYWKAGRGHLDSYEITVVNDAGARINGLLTGEFDAISEVDPKVAERVSTRRGLTLLATPSKNHTTLLMNTLAAPFSDNNFRQAVRHAFNRNQILKTSFSGYGEVGNDNPIAKIDPMYNSQLPPREYDPEKATFLLRKSGLENVAIELFGGPGAGADADTSGQIIQENMKAIKGFNMKYTRTPGDGYHTDVVGKRPFVMNYVTGRPTANLHLSFIYLSNSPVNRDNAPWKNEQFDQLVNVSRSEPDFAKRKQMLWDAQEILYNDGNVSCYIFKSHLDAHSDKVKGFIKDATWDFCGGRAIDRVWMA